jgi:hypothetical protein
MPFNAKDTAKYRQDVSSDGNLLAAKDREELVKVCTASRIARPDNC